MCGAVLKIPISEISKVIEVLLQECNEPAIEAAVVIEGKVTKKETPEGVRLKVIYPHPTNPHPDILEKSGISEEEVTEEDEVSGLAGGDG